MARSSTGWRRSLTNSMASNRRNVAGGKHAARHRKALARKIRKAENSTRGKDHRGRHGRPEIRRRVGFRLNRRGGATGVVGESLQARYSREPEERLQETWIRSLGNVRT